MAFCIGCGNELSSGRFCTSCGRPVPTDAWSGDHRTDTAERPAAQVPPPPPTLPPPPPSSAPPPLPPPPADPMPNTGPRYPLFADEVEAPVAPTVVAPVVSPGPPSGPAGPTRHTNHRRRPWGMWVSIAAVLALVALLGVWLLAGSNDDPAPASATERTPATSSKSDKPSGSKSKPAHTPKAPPAQPGDVTSQSTVKVPATAPPNEDTSGNKVTYNGANMLDRVPETCWRMPGDGAGKEIRITLPGKTVVNRVGLINGYAKSAKDGGRTLDWYAGNRRIESVEWVFDDGTTLSQNLTDTTALQSIQVDDVTTSAITLRLVHVSKPGNGPAARNYTAISDLSILGDSSQGNG